MLIKEELLCICNVIDTIDVFQQTVIQFTLSKSWFFAVHHCRGPEKWQCNVAKDT